MSIINDIENKVKEWLFTIAVKKAIVRVAQLIISFFAAKGITFIYNGAPVNVDTLTAILMGLFEILRNFLKVKFPKVFGSWL
jgi:NADH/NAD ratio-sensing transcriptional regulator Rex